MFLRVYSLAELVVLLGQPLGFPILKIWETLFRRLCLKLECRHQRPLEAERDVAVGALKAPLPKADYSGQLCLRR